MKNSFTLSYSVKAKKAAIPNTTQKKKKILNSNSMYSQTHTERYGICVFAKHGIQGLDSYTELDSSLQLYVQSNKSRGQPPVSFASWI